MKCQHILQTVEICQDPFKGRRDCEVHVVKCSKCGYTTNYSMPKSKKQYKVISD